MKTAQDKLRVDELRIHFNNQPGLTVSDITKFYRSKEPAVKKTTLNWRIYNLIQKGVLTRIGRGKFTLGEGISYCPEVTTNQISLFKELKTAFPFISICIWSTSVINEFMLHQPGRHFHLIEVEKEGIESLFYFLKEKNMPVYMNPTAELIRRYVLSENEPWIIKPLVSESPTQEISGITTITIEKMLVDIFCDTVLFSAQQGSEMDQIFNEAFEKFAINESKMLRYASRRRKKIELDRYLNKISKYRQ
ncbi:MAG: hypothetical protein GC181_07430 [Bacteroidetes bacterium]|nr:hypothetical protein [Bacteroidota bacterium]